MDATRPPNTAGRGQGHTDFSQNQDSIGSGRASKEANNCTRCRLLQSRVRELEAQLDLKSREFSEAITQLTINQRARTRAEQMDERFIEQCVRARTEAEIELDKRSKQYAAQIEKIKADAQSKNNESACEVKKIQRQMTEHSESCRKQIAEVNQNARDDAARYEQIITKLKAESAGRIEVAVAQARQQYATLVDKARHIEQQNLRLKEEFSKRLALAGEKLRQKEEEIANIKGQLAAVGDKIAASAREKARAEQLNQRLLEQCRMAKAGADVEIEMRTKELTENAARLKGQATSKLQVLVNENAQLKSQTEQAAAKLREHIEALNRANVRIKSLEHVVANLKSQSLAPAQY